MMAPVTSTETRSAKANTASPTRSSFTSAPTAVTFYQGIEMPHADNCYLYRRTK